VGIAIVIDFDPDPDSDPDISSGFYVLFSEQLIFPSDNPSLNIE